MSLLCHLVKQEGLCLALLGVAQNSRPLCNYFWFKFLFQNLILHVMPAVLLRCVCLVEVTEPKAFLPGFISSRLRGEWIVCKAEDKRLAGTLGCFSFFVLICQTIGEGKASCTT